MRLNITGQNLPAARDPLQRRLADLSPPSRTEGHASADEAALRSEARERLMSGRQDNRRASKRPGGADAKRRSAKSWTFWAVFDILLLLMIVPIVVSAPPVFECRRIQNETGFFAGNSFEKCARKGISERWSILDSRLKMLVRGSGQ